MTVIVTGKEAPADREVVASNGAKLRIEYAVGQPETSTVECWWVDLQEGQWPADQELVRIVDSWGDSGTVVKIGSSRKFVAIRHS